MYPMADENEQQDEEKNNVCGMVSDILDENSLIITHRKNFLLIIDNLIAHHHRKQQQQHHNQTKHLVICGNEQEKNEYCKTLRNTERIMFITLSEVTMFHHTNNSSSFCNVIMLNHNCIFNHLISNFLPVISRHIFVLVDSFTPSLSLKITKFQRACQYIRVHQTVFLSDMSYDVEKHHHLFTNSNSTSLKLSSPIKFNNIFFPSTSTSTSTSTSAFSHQNSNVSSASSSPSDLNLPRRRQQKQKQYQRHSSTDTPPDGPNQISYSSSTEPIPPIQVSRATSSSSHLHRQISPVTHPVTSSFSASISSPRESNTYSIASTSCSSLTAPNSIDHQVASSINLNGSTPTSPSGSKNVKDNVKSCGHEVKVEDEELSVSESGSDSESEGDVNSDNYCSSSESEPDSDAESAIGLKGTDIKRNNSILALKPPLTTEKEFITTTYMTNIVPKTLIYISHTPEGAPAVQERKRDMNNRLIFIMNRILNEKSTRLSKNLITCIILMEKELQEESQGEIRPPLQSGIEMTDWIIYCRKHHDKMQKFVVWIKALRICIESNELADWAVLHLIKEEKYPSSRPCITSAIHILWKHAPINLQILTRLRNEIAHFMVAKAMHLIIIVDLPPMADVILKYIQQCKRFERVKPKVSMSHFVLYSKQEAFSWDCLQMDDSFIHERIRYFQKNQTDKLILVTTSTFANKNKDILHDKVLIRINSSVQLPEDIDRNVEKQTPAPFKSGPVYSNPIIRDDNNNGTSAEKGRRKEGYSDAAVDDVSMNMLDKKNSSKDERNNNTTDDDDGGGGDDFKSNKEHQQKPTPIVAHGRQINQRHKLSQFDSYHKQQQYNPHPAHSHYRSGNHRYPKHNNNENQNKAIPNYRNNQRHLDHQQYSLNSYSRSSSTSSRYRHAPNALAPFPPPHVRSLSNLSSSNSSSTSNEESVTDMFYRKKEESRARERQFVRLLCNTKSVKEAKGAILSFANCVGATIDVKHSLHVINRKTDKIKPRHMSTMTYSSDVRDFKTSGFAISPTMSEAIAADKMLNILKSLAL